MSDWKSAALSISVSLLSASTAYAHVSITSGPATANTTQEVTFGVGHGCAGADTYSIQVHLPATITSVRPVDSPFGRPVLTKDMAGVVTAVTWTKDQADVLLADEQYYKLTLRMRIPDAPFTVTYVHVTQVCRDAMGVESVVEWEALPDGAGEPAAELVIVPARVQGWNKYTVASQVVDLATFFKEAQIVWAGNAAFSTNATTTELIAREPGVTALSQVEAGTEIWVKY